LLGQLPDGRRALLFECYCSDAFVACFDLSMPPTGRFYIEQAFEILGPKLTACLVTPIAGIIPPRLHNKSGDIEDGVTFASLLQWLRMFYDGPLPKRKLGTIQIGFGTAAPDPAQYLLVPAPLQDPSYASDETAVNRVLSGLRKEADRLVLDANRRIDVKVHVCQWLVDDTTPGIGENLIATSRHKVCRMIESNFKILKYKAAMRT
jgi:hypothetical protein